MVMQDAVTAWDIKPNRQDTNEKFNMLCNVVPIEHPWSWDWYIKKIDVKDWSRAQYWFEKCKWLKKCDLYEYVCKDWKYKKEEELSNEQQIANKKWENWNFTDVVTFQSYRIYMRRVNNVLNPYWETQRDLDWKTYVESWWDWDKDTCDKDVPSALLWKAKINKEISTAKNSQIITYNNKNEKVSEEDNPNWVPAYQRSNFIRIYVQNVDTKSCSWDTFDWPDESPIVLVKEYPASECNPDHFITAYGGIWTPEMLWENISIYMIYFGGNLFAYMRWLDKTPKNLNNVYISDLWIYVTLVPVGKENSQIISSFKLEQDWYFISEVSELSTMLKLPDMTWLKVTTSADIRWIEETKIETPVYWFPEWWEVPYFVAWDKLYSINGFFTRKDWKCDIPTDKEFNDVVFETQEEGKKRLKDNDWCVAINVTDKTRKVFIIDTEIVTAYSKWAITWIATRWWRISYISDWWIYISWNWKLNWNFSPYFSSQQWADVVRWAFRIPAWLTDLIEYNSSLILMWPRNIYWLVSEDQLKAWIFVTSWDNQDWYYCPWSYFNDEWEILIVRRWKVLESMELAVSYWVGQIGFKPDTWFFINWHIKACNNDYDTIHIDATINHRYVSIYDDNNVWEHYSKLLIYDKHYNCWYHWLITWARVVHVKDNIFLWDWVYANKWRTRWWKDDDTKWWEIIENISVYVWEEWLQTPKHIQYVKTAIWNHSVISSNSKWSIDLSYWGKLFERTNDITTTRYPRLLFKKDSKWIIETYDNWEKIYWYWEMFPYTLLNEIKQYRNYNDTRILREMWNEIDMDSKLALFASIKEPVNTPANVLEISITARWLDNIQFWSFYIWYYQLDADYEDIENTNIDVSEYSDRTMWYTLDEIHKWEFCEEVLQWSACDITYDDKILNP